MLSYEKSTKVIALVLFLLLATVAAADDYFEEMADVPANMSFPTAAAVGDDIYLVSGYEDGAGWTKNMYRYNIPTDTWSTDTPDKAALPDIYTPRTEACNTGYIEESGVFCVIGGNEGSGLNPIGPTDAVECYDPELNSWQTLESLPQSISGVYCAVHEGVIYVTGGYTGSYSTTLYWMDTGLETPTWNTETTSRTVSSAFGGGAITQDPSLSKATDGEYRFSQFMGSAIQSTHWGLDSESWSAAPDKEKRGYACIIEDNDFNTLIIGGSNFATSIPYQTYDSVLAYDSLEDQWVTATSTLPLSTGGMACAQDDEGNIYLFNGYSTDDAKDMKINVLFAAYRLEMEETNDPVWNGGWLYLNRNARAGNWGNVVFFLYLQGQTAAIPMPADDVEIADNGAMRARLSLESSFTGRARLAARLNATGRAGFADFMVGDEPADEDKNIFKEDFEDFKIGIRINWNQNRWNVEEEEPFQFGVRLSFKDGDGTILEAYDPDDATAGQIWSALWPIEEGTFTYEWDAYFEDGDGLSMALYDDVVNELSHGLLVHMLEGGVSIETPDAKAETDCSVVLTTGQWYSFSFAVDLDAGTGTLSVDGTESACAGVTVPFGADSAVQALGYVLPDDLTGGTTYIDNIEVLGFEEPPPADDDDDDSDDDDSGDDDDSTDDDDATDDDSADTDDDDNDDDDGCCGC